MLRQELIAGLGAAAWRFAARADECRGISESNRAGGSLRTYSFGICNIRLIRSPQSMIIQFPCSESYHFWKCACSVSSSRKSAPFPTAIHSP